MSKSRDLPKRATMRDIRIPEDTLQFLLWLVKQDVTLPHVIVDYLKWEEYTKREIKEHLHNLTDACYQSQEDTY